MPPTRTSIKLNKLGKTLAMMLVAIMAMLSFNANAFADPSQDNLQAQNELQSAVKQKVAGNIYGLEGGGQTTGNDLLTLNDATHQYEVDSVKFSQLDSKAQNQFISDVTKSARYEADPANPKKSPLVTDQTVTDWFRQLQDTPGVGSKMLSEMMGDTAPDFVGAHQTLSPLQKGFNLILGIIGVFMMMGLAITILLDVSYMVVPFIRTMIGDGDTAGANGEKGIVRKTFSVSSDARNAMKKADDENGSTASALMSYLWKRSFGLIVFGILLVLLVNGKLFNLVGTIMDAVSGLPIFR